MLPQEWPLARLSAQLRHVGVLLRVTLYRRLAELSFRGALSISCHVKLCGRYDETSMSFVEQPQVSWHLCLHSFGLSKQMTSSLTPQGWPCMRIQTSGCMGCCPLVPKRVRPKLWKARGIPAFRPRDENATPALESNRNAFSLMQTVVMSFGRNLCLGKPDLPIYHLHENLPVQLIHKLVESMGVLRFRDVTPEEGKRYKHNSDNEANNPYIIVGSYEGQWVSNDYPAFPETPRLAYAYEQGLLDGSFGQMVSIQSSCRSIFRLEAPVWHNVADGLVVARGDSKRSRPCWKEKLPCPAGTT